MPNLRSSADTCTSSPPATGGPRRASSLPLQRLRHSRRTTGPLLKRGPAMSASTPSNRTMLWTWPRSWRASNHADRLPVPRADGDREALRILLGARHELTVANTAQTNRLRALLLGGEDTERDMARTAPGRRPRPRLTTSLADTP